MFGSPLVSLCLESGFVGSGVAPGVVAWPESGYESDAAAQQL